MHADGRLAEPPIALVEVQAYVYLAKRGWPTSTRALGDDQRAGDLLRAGRATLRERFNEAFWMEDEQYFAGALDGDKRPGAHDRCPTPGTRCTATSWIRTRRAAVAKRLLAPDMFSGWGIRTMSKAAAAYNPMSYHNGSVWPHDNALIAAGLKRYGFVAFHEPCGDGAVRRGDPRGLPPAARAVLRVHPAHAEPPGELPGRVLARRHGRPARRS